MLNKNFYKFFKKKKVFITGNTGFVGSYLCLILNIFGAKILGFSLKKKNKNYLSNNKKFLRKFETIYDDINNINLYKKRIIKFNPDIIIHLASQPIVIDSYEKTFDTYQTNIIGLVKLLDIAKSIKFTKSIIIFTSDKVYLNQGKKILDENAKLGGKDPYSSSKSSQDIIANSYKYSFFKKTKNLTIIRAGNIIGGGDFQTSRLIPDLYLESFKKKNIILRNPNAVRPWQHILDVSSALINVIVKKSNRIYNDPIIYNIGPLKNSNLKVLDLTKEILKLNKIKKIKIFKKKINFQETNILKISSNKIIKELNWKPKLYIKESIKLTNDWYSNMFLKNKIDIFEYTLNQIKKYFNL